MKRIYAFLAFFVWSSSMVVAQDTLLFENFNTPFDQVMDTSDGVAAIPSGSDQIWVNFDADNVQDASGRPMNWYWREQWQGADTSTQGGVLVSSSWLANNVDGAENWLILPPLHLADGSAVLSWKSAPYQGPRYMDGYKVVVSAFRNFTPQFTDTIFEHAQMTVTGIDTMVNTYTFDTGYVHANYYTDTTYFYFDSILNGYRGLLEPHSISLAQFANFTIYIAFVHDSDNDNSMALDDILVTGTAVVNTNELEKISKFRIAPNPAVDFFNLNYTSTVDKNVDIRIFDIQGRLVHEQFSISNHIGDVQKRINVSSFPKGTYKLVLYQNGQTRTQSFIKL